MAPRIDETRLTSQLSYITGSRAEQALVLGSIMPSIHPQASLIESAVNIPRAPQYVFSCGRIQPHQTMCDVTGLHGISSTGTPKRYNTARFDVSAVSDRYDNSPK